MAVGFPILLVVRYIMLVSVYSMCTVVSYIWGGEWNRIVSQIKSVSKARRKRGRKTGDR